MGKAKNANRNSEMKPPLVSIIIPVKNGEKTIRECLESIRTQTSQNFEVLVLDGASTDATQDIVNSYLSKMSNLQWTSEKDAGVYDAMNKGIKKSMGKWLYFMGCDDRLCCETVIQHIEHEVFLSKGENDILYGDVIFENTSKTSQHKSFRKRDFLTQNLNHQSMFFRRRVFKIKGDFSSDFPVFADWHFNISCFLDPRIRTKYVDRVIAFYSNKGLSSVEIDDFPERAKHHYKATKIFFGWQRPLRALGRMFRTYLKYSSF